MEDQVLDEDGNPMRPTERFGNIRDMLADGRARIVKRDPLTIQLRCEGAPFPMYEQPLTTTCGFSASGF